MPHGRVRQIFSRHANTSHIPNKESLGNLPLKLWHFTSVPSHSQKSPLSCWEKKHCVLPVKKKRHAGLHSDHRILGMNLKWDPASVPSFFQAELCCPCQEDCLLKKEQKMRNWIWIAPYFAFSGEWCLVETKIGIFQVLRAIPTGAQQTAGSPEEEHVGNAWCWSLPCFSLCTLPQMVTWTAQGLHNAGLFSKHSGTLMLF